MGIQPCCENTIIVDLPAEPAIREQLDMVIQLVHAGGVGDVIVDFSNVGIINSLSLSGLLQLRKALNNTKQKLILCSVKSMTRKIFDVTCLNSNFEFAEDKSAALQSIQAGK